MLMFLPGFDIFLMKFSSEELHTSERRQSSRPATCLSGTVQSSPATVPCRLGRGRRSPRPSPAPQGKEEEENQETARRAGQCSRACVGAGWSLRGMDVRISHHLAHSFSFLLTLAQEFEASNQNVCSHIWEREKKGQASIKTQHLGL